MEPSWLLELLKQGGLAFGLGLTLWLLKLQVDERIKAEREAADERVALEKRSGDEKLAIEKKAHDETRLMWQETRAIVQENNRLISAFMERFQISSSQQKPPRRRALERVGENTQQGA